MSVASVAAASAAPVAATVPMSRRARPANSSSRAGASSAKTPRTISGATASHGKRMLIGTAARVSAHRRWREKKQCAGVFCASCGGVPRLTAAPDTARRARVPIPPFKPHAPRHFFPAPNPDQCPTSKTSTNPSRASTTNFATRRRSAPEPTLTRRNCETRRVSEPASARLSNAPCTQSNASSIHPSRMFTANSSSTPSPSKNGSPCSRTASSKSSTSSARARRAWSAPSSRGACRTSTTG